MPGNLHTAPFGSKTHRVYDVNTKQGVHSLLVKSFLYMFLLLLITVAVAGTLIAVFFNVLPFTDANYNTFRILLISASISQIVLTIVLAFFTIKQKKTAIIPMILYAVCMGVLISSFGIILDPLTLLSTFGITCLVFGAIALIGVLAKNASGFALVGGGLAMSALLVSLFSVIFFLFLRDTNTMWWINIVVSAALCIAFMLITTYDVWRIKKIAEMGVETPNLALFTAFNLYLDFIVILMYILRFVAIAFGSRR